MSALCQLAHHLEAGEELDALLAIHVMGWTMLSVHQRQESWARWTGTSAAPMMKVSEWKPSGNIVQALRVLDACGAGLTQDGKGMTWGTAIRRTGRDHWEVSLSEDMMGTTKSVWAPTLELAIARAALVWALRKEIADERTEEPGEPNLPPQPPVPQPTF